MTPGLNVHLGVSRQQLGPTLIAGLKTKTEWGNGGMKRHSQYQNGALVCGQQEEAETEKSESPAHCHALCDAGISTFVAPAPAYY